MSWAEFFWIAVVIVLVLLPPKYDPAIRLKEYNENKRPERDNG